MHEIIISWLEGFPKELATFLIAVIPVTELRASLPIAIKVYKLSAFSAWFFSVMGTFLAMVLVVFFLDPVADFLSKYIPFFQKFFKWLFEHTRERNHAKMEKYGEWAIFVLSATPIPFVGGLTGALAAFVFGVPKKKSLPLLLFGTMVSGGIVLLLTIYL
jgi:uncharacterized membrane protein